MQLCIHTHCFSTALSAAWHHIFIFSSRMLLPILKVLLLSEKYYAALFLCLPLALSSRLHDVKQCSISSLGNFCSCASWPSNTVEDETTDHCKRNALLHSISKAQFTLLSLISWGFLFRRCGLWYWCSKDHSDGEITTVRNGSNRSTVQIYLHGSTALHWNATAQNWRGTGIFIWSINYVGIRYHWSRE